MYAGLWLERVHFFDKSTHVTGHLSFFYTIFDKFYICTEGQAPLAAVLHLEKARLYAQGLTYPLYTDQEPPVGVAELVLVLLLDVDVGLGTDYAT